MQLRNSLKPCGFGFSVSNEDSEISEGRRRYPGRRRREDDDDTVLDNQDVSSVTSQDQGTIIH